MFSFQFPPHTSNPTWSGGRFPPVFSISHHNPHAPSSLRGSHKVRVIFSNPHAKSDAMRWPFSSSRVKDGYLGCLLPEPKTLPSPWLQESFLWIQQNCNVNISAVRFEICDRNFQEARGFCKISESQGNICSFLIDPFNDVLFNLRWSRSQSLPWPLLMTITMTLGNQASRNQNWLGGFAASFWRGQT